MKATRKTISSAAVGGMVVLCASGMASGAFAQGAAQFQPVTRVAAVLPGSIQGIVLDETGAPVPGAMVSAVGASHALAETDRGGHFELRSLSPGPYLVRAHLTGFVGSRGQVVDVRPSTRVTSSIALRHAAPPNASAAGAAPVLAAGVGGSVDPAPAPPDEGSTPSAKTTTDQSEVAWRLRHVRRGILKDATVPVEILADDGPETNGFGATSSVGHAVSSPARLASSLFAGTPFSGQLNLLTTGSFDTPQQLFSTDNFSRSVAYIAVGAPIGAQGDWKARAALTQGDIASWFVAGEYTTSASNDHHYNIGVSYSTQRYDGGNFAALRDVTDGSRNAGAIYGFDTFSIADDLTVSYGARYARYDYLEHANLISPRASLTFEPTPHLRVTTLVSRRTVAPGAEEFAPPSDAGVWLPPQRTFSSLLTGRPLDAERADHVELAVERDIAAATVAVRAYRQHVDNQLVTLFGVDMPGAPAAVGHYFLASAGAIDASVVSASLRAALASRVHGSVEYSTTRAAFNPADESAFMLLFAPSAMRTETERIHDVATSVETDVPETSTHVIVLYRVSNGFAHPGARIAPAAPGAGAQPDRAGVDSRFDVQVRQSLPFMDFNSAKWEMLFGVRNFFREAAPDQSVYDELLVVRPPKRIVGGLTLKF